MSDLGLNKIMAAAFSTGLAILGLNAASDAFFSHEKPGEPGYLVEVASADSGHGDDTPKWVPPTDYGVLLAEADIAKGEKKSAACISCHKFEQGGGNGTGPELYNIVMRDTAGVAGFGYSAVLTAMGGQWDYAALDGFLKNPKKYAPGTAMNYAGLSKEKDRMNMIAYLRTLSPSPAALPAPLPAEAFIEPSADDAHAEAHAAVEVHAEEHVETVELAVEDASLAMDEAVDAANAAVEALDYTADTAVDAATDTVTDELDAAAGDASALVEEVVEDAEDAAKDVKTQHGPHN